MTNTSPRYEHDCDYCTFLGTEEGQDLYLCGASLVRRFGNEPHENGAWDLDCGAPPKGSLYEKAWRLSKG